MVKEDKLTKTSFSSFFNHIDNFSQEEFLYVTSGGIPAARPSVPPTVSSETGHADRKSQREALAEVEPESDGEPDGEEGEG